MNNTVKQKFPERLREAREMRKMTQSELAKKSGCVSIAQFETGARLPSAENIVKLALALNVTTDNLLGMPNYFSYSDDLTNEQVETVNYLIKYWKEKREVLEQNEETR